MNYKEYIAHLERLLEGKDRVMYLFLINTIVAIGKETEHEDFKKELRKFYVEIKNTPNPISMSNGSIINEKSWNRLKEIMIKIIDLLNDYYGNYNFIQPKKL